MAHLGSDKQQLICQRYLEQCEDASNPKHFDEWIKYYVDKMDQSRKELIATHDPLTRALDQHDEIKREIKYETFQRMKERNNKHDRDEEHIILLTSMIQEGQLKLALLTREIHNIRQMRNRKHREIAEHEKRYNHWNIVKMGWHWIDYHRFEGRFYYCTQKELDCIIDADPRETAKSISKKVWKIREELGVHLLVGRSENVFV